jgi:hypothetical protein
LKFWKKTLSYFIPNNHMTWNDLALAGNPTKSTKVHKLLKVIKRKEAARLGRPSQARRALFASEYKSAIDVMDSNDDEEMRTFLSSYFKFQYNMIARLDDSTKFRLPDLKTFNKYPEFGIVTRLCWSKNVLDERDAPDQILLGSVDHHYCALIGLGTWLKFHFTMHPVENEYIFGINGLSDYVAIKNKASFQLCKVFKCEDFNVVDEGIRAHCNCEIS